MNSKVNRQLSHQSFLQDNRILTRIVSMLTILGMLLFFHSPVYATFVCSGYDTITTVYFEKDGEPYNKPVDFTINCYGYAGLDFPRETPEEVLSWSFTCPDYPCQVLLPYRLEYAEIAYCDCEGQTEGENFVIEKYSSSPVDFSKCDRSGERLADDDRLPAWFDFCQPSFFCELIFDIPTSPDLTDAAAAGELTDSDTQGEPTDSDGDSGSTDADRDGGNNGGCFITILLRE